MRAIGLVVMLALAGCGAAHGMRAETARRICKDNGHALGTPGFDSCFRDTFAAASLAASGD